MKTYTITFKREMIATAQVSAENKTDAIKAFNNGEWLDFYEEREILDQVILKVKDEK